MRIAISCESMADFSKELIKKFNIQVIPTQILLGDEVKNDGEISNEEIIEFVNRTGVLPKTSAVNIARFEEYFTNLKKDYDAIIHCSISSGLSGTFSNASTAAAKMKNVYVVDTKTLSTGIALLVLYARKLADEGVAADKIYEAVCKRVDSVQVSFPLTKLDFLYKGGRCNSLSYFCANLLKIRPQIIMKDGKMVLGKKYRGSFEHVVKCYCRDSLEEYDNPDLENAFVTYTTAEPIIIEIAVNALKDRGFKNIYITRAGGTITSHSGENCMGILFINDGGAEL